MVDSGGGELCITVGLLGKREKKWSRTVRNLFAAMMRHMAHFCVAFRPKATPKRRQCDTVLAKNAGRIAVTAKKPAGGGP
jgi:hypothetical protein